MRHRWILVTVYIVSTISVAGGWKWHVEAGPNVLDKDENNQRSDGDNIDSTNVHISHLRSTFQQHRSMQQRQLQDDQTFKQSEVNNVNLMTKSSGIQSHSDKDQVLDMTTLDINIGNVRSQYNSNEVQEQKTLEVDQSTQNPTKQEIQNSVEVDAIVVENVSETVKTSNTLGIPPEIPKENVVISQQQPEMLQNLVVTLQEQLIEAQTSQVRTRSILNVIQETQETQAKDLQTLKDTLEEMRGEQVTDRQAIKKLQKIAEDNAWGVSDLKTSSDIIRKDFTAFKALQLSHNNTMIDLENLAATNEIDHDKYQHSIKHIQHNVNSIKNQMEEDRSSLIQLSNQFELATRQAEDIPSVPNNIPAVPSDNKYDNGGFEGSGDKSGEVNKEFDEFASSIEEKHNIIGHRIQKILAKERKMEKDMVTVQEKFNQYDNDLSKLYVMFFNLSLQMSGIEKKLVNNQQAQIQTELQQLQQGFVNFTQQLLSLQQRHVSPDGEMFAQNQLSNSPPQNAMERYRTKIEEIEDSLVDDKVANQQNAVVINNRISLLNNTISEMRRQLTDHHVRATDVFDDVDGHVMDFKTSIQHNDERLTRLEVKVLNVSLEACHKTNADLRQDNSLHRLERGISKLNKRTDEQAERLAKLERGISNLFEVADNQGNSLSKIMDGVQTVMEQLPEIKGLRKEVKNFMMQLPEDCSMIREQNPGSESGAYLIRPKHSPGTAWVECQFDTSDTWTVIQKRDSGELDFAMNWDEYRYGFGDPTSEYWLGNDNLHYLTHQKEYRLQISMWDHYGRYWYAEYDHFMVDDLEESYTLHIDGYHGNATDAMTYSDRMPFSTYDNDNDGSSTHCAKFHTAGWWYKHCQYANLNGRYMVGIVWFNHNSDEWVQMQRTEMKVTPHLPKVRHFNLDNSTEEKDVNAT